jgi:hypothetical protein
VKMAEVSHQVHNNHHDSGYRGFFLKLSPQIAKFALRDIGLAGYLIDGAVSV